MADGPTSTNPVVKSIISGKAPPAARLAAARGLLPLPQTDLLEALVHLGADDNPDVASAALSTLNGQQPQDLLSVAKADDVAPAVLGYFASLSSADRNLHEAVAGNHNTPDEAIALLARITADPSLLEFITLNQQRLIRTPGIIDAILMNSSKEGSAV